VNQSGEQILEGAGLQVGFDFRGDRLGHEIRLADGSAWLAALRSVEDSPTADWPSSPPLQSLHFETSAEHGQVALLVGMAGQSHWSASVKIGSSEGKLHFDIACRVRGPRSGLLGSRYQTSLPLVAHDERQAWLAVPGPSTKVLHLRLDDPWQQSRLEATPAGLAIIASSSTLLAASQTVRWGYWVAAVSAPGK
jgi:hypothetical protein